MTGKDQQELEDKTSGECPEVSSPPTHQLELSRIAGHVDDWEQKSNCSSLPHARLPVEHDHQGSGAGVAGGLGDQEALAIGSDVEEGAGYRARIEERLGEPVLEVSPSSSRVSRFQLL